MDMPIPYLAISSFHEERFNIIDVSKEFLGMAIASSHFRLDGNLNRYQLLSDAFRKMKFS